MAETTTITTMNIEYVHTFVCVLYMRTADIVEVIYSSRVDIVDNNVGRKKKHTHEEIKEKTKFVRVGQKNRVAEIHSSNKGVATLTSQIYHVLADMYYYFSTLCVCLFKLYVVICHRSPSVCPSLHQSHSPLLLVNPSQFVF